MEGKEARSLDGGGPLYFDILSKHPVVVRLVTEKVTFWCWCQMRYS